MSRILDGMRYRAQVSLESARAVAGEICDSPPLCNDDYVAILDSHGETLEKWEAAFDGPGGGAIWRLTFTKEIEPVDRDDPPEGAIDR